MRRTESMRGGCGMMAWVLVLAGGPAMVPASALAEAPAVTEAALVDEGNAGMDEGDRHAEAGDHAAAARAYAKAYVTYSQRAKTDTKEKQALSLALDEFGLAQAAEPENIGLLAEEAALLERYEERMGELTPALAMERERVTARTEELREQAAARFEELRKRKAAEAAAAEAEAAKEEQEEIEPEVRLEKPAARTDKGGVVLVSVGAVSLAGGVALLANGVWNIGKARRRGDELLETIDGSENGTPEMRGELRQEVADWQTQWRIVGTGLAVGGAMVAAVGVGLMSVGIVRMRRNKRMGGHAWVVGPVMSGGEVGITVAGRW